jgi:hypothetical protein
LNCTIIGIWPEAERIAQRQAEAAIAEVLEVVAKAERRLHDMIAAEHT